MVQGTGPAPGERVFGYVRKGLIHRGTSSELVKGLLVRPPTVIKDQCDFDEELRGR
jgi:hypothetical protein